MCVCVVITAVCELKHSLKELWFLVESLTFEMTEICNNDRMMVGEAVHVISVFC